MIWGINHGGHTVARVWGYTRTSAGDGRVTAFWVHTKSPSEIGVDLQRGSDRKLMLTKSNLFVCKFGVCVRIEGYEQTNRPLLSCVDRRPND